MPRRQQVAALAAAAWALLFAARMLTAARDPWEWDEVLFTSAVRDGIDLRAGRPHAPGYPLFVTCGRALAALGVEPFRAATITGLAGGLLAPAALAALLLALEVPLAWATIGGALYAFIPAVWLHAVRPLSDSFAAAAFLASAAALVAAARRGDGRFLIVGAGAAGLCFGVRPQAAVALLPFAAWAALRVARKGGARFALASAGLGLAVSALTTLPAVLGSGGWASYRALVGRQAAYVRAEDSLRLADFAKADTWTRWVRDPFGPDTLAAVFLLFALAGTVVAPRKALALAAVFVPLAALTIPFSSLPAAPRYALVLLPLPAALGALALGRLAVRSRRAAAISGAALVGASAAVGAPAAIEVATRTSPAVAAFRALRDDPALAGRPLVVWSGLAQHRRAILPGRPAREIRENDIADVSAQDLIVMSDDSVFGQVPTRRFAFANSLLPRISRARYLNVSIVAGEPRVGILRPWLDGSGDFDWATGDAVLAPGAVLTVRGPVGPVEMTVTAAATPRMATILKVTSNGGARHLELVSGETRVFAFRASPDSKGSLFSLAVEDGPASLTGWRVRPGGSP